MTLLLHGIPVRDAIRPGDLGLMIYQHAAIYSRECGYDVTFEAYVAESLAKFGVSRSERERVWIAERDGQFAGCIGIVRRTDEEAQLRWFLVDPSARGIGLGRRLFDAALAFARASGYETVMLWTEREMRTAVRMYEAAGFRKVEEKPGTWGVEVLEEKYVLALHGNT